MSDKSLIIKIVVLMIVSFTMGVFLSKVPQNLRLSILEQQIKKYCSSGCNNNQTGHAFNRWRGSSSKKYL